MPVGEEILEKAGHSDGIEATLWVSEGLEKIAQQVKADLSGLGIDLIIESVPPDLSTFRAYIREMQINIFLMDTTVKWDTTSELLGRLLQKGGAENYYYCIEGEFNSLYQDGFFKLAEDSAFKDYPIVPLFWH